MSPTDAIKTFYSCGLDILIIGDYVIKKIEKNTQQLFSKIHPKQLKDRKILKD